MYIYVQCRLSVGKVLEKCSEVQGATYQINFGFLGFTLPKTIQGQ